MKYIAFPAIFATLIVAGCDATPGAGNAGLMVPGQTYDAVNMSRMPRRVTFRPDGIVTVYEPGEAEPERQRWSRRNGQICIDDMAEAVKTARIRFALMSVGPTPKAATRLPMKTV